MNLGSLQMYASYVKPGLIAIMWAPYQISYSSYFKSLSHISSVSFISSTPIYQEDSVFYFTEEKGAISSSYLLSTWEIAFVLSVSQYLIPCLRRRGEKVFSEPVLYYFCSLFQKKSFSSESVSILIKPC